jgi:inositol 1,4,5-triphosphate receptor type 3
MVTEHGVEGGAGNEGAKKASADDTAKNAAAEQGHSVRKVIRILRFLQLLVEGHYRSLQDHMREQRMFDGQINPKSFDFVAFISTMLGVFEKQYVNCYSCDMGNQMIDTLIELIQGPCKENQATLVSSKVIDNCRDLIS